MAIRVSHEVPIGTLGRLGYTTGRLASYERDVDRVNQYLMARMQINAGQQARREGYAFQREENKTAREQEMAKYGKELEEAGRQRTQAVDLEKVRQAGDYDLEAMRQGADFDLEAMRQAGDLDIEGLNQAGRLEEQAIRGEQELEAMKLQGEIARRGQKLAYSEQQKREIDKITNGMGWVQQQVGERRWSPEQGEQALDQLWERYHGITPLPTWDTSVDPNAMLSQAIAIDPATNERFLFDQKNGKFTPLKSDQVSLSDFAALYDQAYKSVVDANALADIYTQPSPAAVQARVEAMLKSYETYTKPKPAAEEEGGGASPARSWRDLQTGQVHTIGDPIDLQTGAGGSVVDEQGDLDRSLMIGKILTDPARQKAVVDGVRDKHGETTAGKVKAIFDTEDPQKITAMLKVLGVIDDGKAMNQDALREGIGNDLRAGRFSGTKGVKAAMENRQDLTRFVFERFGAEDAYELSRIFASGRQDLIKKAIDMLRAVPPGLEPDWGRMTNDERQLALDIRGNSASR